jgi:DNA-binding beta-propeller fold protein YncE
VGATAALAGCLGDSGGGGTPTVLVFNTGDRTVSVIDAETDELLESIFVDTTASFPANQTGVLGPSHFAVAGSDLFVSCSAGDSVAVVDPVDRRLCERIPVGAVLV